MGQIEIDGLIWWICSVFCGNAKLAKGEDSGVGDLSHNG